jgi:tetratricopeptide (TPR) repeat protein
MRPRTHRAPRRPRIRHALWRRVTFPDAPSLPRPISPSTSHIRLFSTCWQRREQKRRPASPVISPYLSLGPLFKGREAFLDTLHKSLAKTQDGRAAAVVGKALHGLGGIGKTRLAIEFALRYESEYSALLFVPADTPQKLNAGLAALAGTDVLDLPEKDAREDEVKIRAVLAWLDVNPGWLLNLDNVDDAPAATAVEALVARLRGGHVLVTGRTGEFSAAIETFALDVLSEEDATSLLLEATTRRETAPNDEALARDLARELGGLALALAQSSAYINRQRVGFARYLKLWREMRESVLDWFDRRLVSYNHDVGLATTWAASVEKLTPQGRELLEICAFLDPAPIPKFLLDALPLTSLYAHDALADLFSYSLVSPAGAPDDRATSPGFAVHRLVQDFTRRGMGAGRRQNALQQALDWVSTAFSGESDDVRTWPRLDPLVPHALAAARHGDEASTAEPTGLLHNKLGQLLKSKARQAEAEPLYRRALAIAEASYGQDHTNVAACLNNLANLLRDTNRFAEAEPLYRRALAIAEASHGPNHPEVVTSLNNLAALLSATNQFAEAERLYRRALSIDEASYGPHHPIVATVLNNLAELLRETDRSAEAERLYRRALSIDEATYGPDHPNLAMCLSNLAGLLCATNRPAEAEILLRRALSITEASFGPHHPNVATVLNNLAELLLETDRPAEAEPLFRRALV